MIRQGHRIGGYYQDSAPGRSMGSVFGGSWRLSPLRGFRGGNTPKPGFRMLTNITQKPRSRFGGRENLATA